MKEKLNLVEILKDCPSGTKLYSTIFGVIELDHIEGRVNYPIVIRLKNGNGYESFTKEGRFFLEFDGECTLFPSKEQRDWSKFKPNKEGFVPHCKFKDGDIVATSLGSQVFILKSEERARMGYCYIGYDFEHNNLFHAGMWYFSRLATEEEKQKLFDTIKLNGYKWNVETNTLEKLVKPKFKVGDKIIFASMKYIIDSRAKGTISEITDNKYIFTDGSYMFISNQDNWKLDQDRFDPKTLKPFDRVLVIDYPSQHWCVGLFSYYIKSDTYPCKCVGSHYKYCIPYNDETKHLVGTKKEAPEFYRYWEY